jgi:hypothetical protein
MYDAMQIAACAVLLAETDDGDAVAAAIPAMGVIRFNENGDRISGNLACYGLFQDTAGLELRHFAYYDTATDRFEIYLSRHLGRWNSARSAEQARAFKSPLPSLEREGN